MERKAGDTRSLVAGAWQPQSVNLEERTAEVVFTTGQDVERFDPFTGAHYVERLRVDAQSVNLDRLKRGAPLLDSHDRGSVRAQIGVVRNAWIASGKGHATIQFSKRAEDILQDVADGVIRNVSIGYAPDRQKRTRREGKPDVIELTRWTPFEVSLVTVPADAAAQVRTQVTATETKVREESIMDRETQTATAVVQDAATRERERCGYISTQCRKHGLDTLERELIDGGVPIETCKDRILDALIEAPGHEEIDSRFAPGDGRRERGFSKLLSKALLHRERVEITEDQDALQLASRSMLELARNCATMDGIGLSNTSSKLEIAGRALISSTTLAESIALTAGRSLNLGYESVPRIFAEIFRESSAQNFRTKHMVKLSDVPTIPLVAEGDPYAETTLTDSQETYVCNSYGSILAFTRQLIINDDVEAIARAPQLLGAAAAARESAIVWGVLNTNGNLADATAIFDAGEGNLVTSALSAAALEAGRLAMMSQATENAQKIGLQPVWLVVGPDYLTAAEKLVRPPVDYSTSTLANTLSSQLANQLQLRVDALIPASNFYLFCDARRFDTLEFSYVAGQRGAYIERDTDFSTGALKLKVTLDFGCGVADRRGMYRADAS